MFVLLADQMGVLAVWFAAESGGNPPPAGDDPDGGLWRWLS